MDEEIKKQVVETTCGIYSANAHENCVGFKNELFYLNLFVKSYRSITILDLTMKMDKMRRDNLIKH